MKQKSSQVDYIYTKREEIKKKLIYINSDRNRQMSDTITPVELNRNGNWTRK